MSILIKGTAMPKNCDECAFNYDMFRCMITLKSTMLADTERLSDCPLIELPPHGRLIDADAWIAKVREELLSPHSKKGALEIMGAMFRDVLDAPTIIEAETCNESCTLTKEKPYKNGHEYLMNCAPTITESEGEDEKEM